MSQSTGPELTPIPGIRYYHPPENAVIEGRGGRVRLPCGDLPLPLTAQDHGALQGEFPDYDTIGRGVYEALRINPDCVHAQRYARLLQEAYPHLLSEMASHLLMLDRKDVEVTYLDRKVSYLRVMALLEPANAHFPREIGRTLLDRGLRLSALHQATITLYRAEKFLRQAAELDPAAVQTLDLLAEVSFLLGKYGAARDCWQRLLPSLAGATAEKLERRLAAVAEGKLPRIPVVDYLEALGVAFHHFQAGAFDEAAAIIHDVVDDPVFSHEFPLPEVLHTLGLCYAHLGMPTYAEQYLQEAQAADPGHEEAPTAQVKLGGEAG
jgi:tetratricopeptide (TPR) repeat protein